MSVTRDQLYQQVWVEPMTKVATRYGVSSNYLARVCSHLNVPWPHRGYWAELKAGQAPDRPPLPAARPGEILKWAKGDAVPRPLRSRPSGGADQTDSVGEPRSQVLQRHVLVAGARGHFEKCRLSEVGYLRPFKRNLVDLFVSQEALSYALDTANQLFCALEARGYRVMLAQAGEFRRPELTLYQGQKFDYYQREAWFPHRKTVVYFGAFAVGLTLYESTEEAEATYEWSRPIRYLRVSDSPPKRRPKWMGPDPTSKQQMPSGRLALRAYSPYGGVSWEQRWHEDKPGGLSRKIPAIVRDLESITPTLEQRREEAEHQAEINRLRREAERREQERRDRERRRAEAIKESREQLLAVVEAWAQADSIERFFAEAECRAASLSSDDREEVLERIKQARELLGGTDALLRLRQWKAPRES